MKNYLFFIPLLILASCNSGNEKSEDNNSEIKKDTIQKDSLEIPKVENIMPEGFTIFENIEQIQYCVPIPLTFYQHDDKADLERGQHIFLRSDDSSAYLEIKGLFRSDESIGIKEYFENSYTEDDEAE